MMLCKQTLMCFEDSNVSQEERKEKVSKTGMGKGKGGGGKCEMGREFSVLQDGCEVWKRPTPFERNAVPD